MFRIYYIVCLLTQNIASTRSCATENNFINELVRLKVMGMRIKILIPGIGYLQPVDVFVE